MAADYFYGVDEQNLKNSTNIHQQLQNNTNNINAEQTQNSEYYSSNTGAQNCAQTVPPQYNYGTGTQTTQNTQSGSSYTNGAPLCPATSNKKVQNISILGGFLLGFSYINLYIFVPYSFWDYPIVLAICRLLFVAAFFTYGEFLFKNYKRKGKNSEEVPFPKASREANFWLVCGVLLTFASMLGEIWYETNASFMQWNNSDGLVLMYGMLATHAVAAYWVVCRAGLLYREGSSGFFILDTLNAMFAFPFCRFLALPVFTFKGITENAKQKKVQKTNIKSVFVAFVACVVAFVFFSVAISLLGASDENFANFIDAFEVQISFGLLPDYFGEFIFRFMLSIPVSCYLFSLFSSALLSKQKLAQGDAIALSLEKLRLVPVKLLGFILTLFVMLYTVYFVVQGEYFFSAFMGELPTIFTYAEYARQGFFELCQIMALNLVLLTLVAKTSKTILRESLFLKITSLVLLVQSLLFAATAFSKLALYIYIYGITDLRLLSTWAVLMLAFAVCLAIINTINKHKIIKPLILTCAASFTMLCFIAG